MTFPNQTPQNERRADAGTLFRWTSVVLGSTLLGALGVAHWSGVEKAELDATTIPTGDSDFDGLTDAQEFSFGTSPYFADTDGDGVSDGLELVLESSPVVATDVPDLTTAMGVSVLAHAGQNATNVEIMLYSSDGNLGDKYVAMSIKTPGGFIPLDLERVLSISTVREVTTAQGGALRTITVSLSPLVVQVPGEIHWIAAIGAPGSSSFGAAGTARMEGDLLGNTVQLTRLGHTLPPSASGAAPPDGTIINQPISPFSGETNPTPPGNPGEVCVQSTAVVGSGAGSVVITEVIAAGCQAGWAAFCVPGACSASVGDTFETVNPRNLLGG